MRASMHRVGSFNMCHYFPSATQTSHRPIFQPTGRIDRFNNQIKPTPARHAARCQSSQETRAKKKQQQRKTHQSASQKKPPSTKTTPRQPCPSQSCKPAIHSRHNPSPQAPEPIVEKIGLAWKKKALLSLLLLLLLLLLHRRHPFVQPMRRRGMMASRFRRNGGGEDDCYWLLGEARR
jgi:hypothetical protein